MIFSFLLYNLCSGPVHMDETSFYFYLFFVTLMHVFSYDSIYMASTLLLRMKLALGFDLKVKMKCRHWPRKVLLSGNLVENFPGAS